MTLLAPPIRRVTLFAEQLVVELRALMRQKRSRERSEEIRILLESANRIRDRILELRAQDELETF